MLLPLVVHWLTPLGTPQVLSPLRKVVASAVPLPSRAAETVPLARLEALRDVRFGPETVGKVAGNRASGRVPDDKSPALRVVRLASDDVLLSICAQV